MIRTQIFSHHKTLVCLIAVLLLVPFTASGHRMHAALSTLEVNPRTQSIEIVHRLFIHDVEPALEELYGPDIDFFEQNTLDTLLKNYVRERFWVKLPGGAPAPIKWIGTEIDGDFLWIYQEAPLFTPQGLTIHNTLLMDAADDQVNTLNITLDPVSDTLVFTSQAPDQVLNPL